MKVETYSFPPFSLVGLSAKLILSDMIESLGSLVFARRKTKYPNKKTFPMHSGQGQPFEFTVAQYIQGVPSSSDCIATTHAVWNTLPPRTSSVSWCIGKQCYAPSCHSVCSRHLDALHLGVWLWIESLYHCKLLCIYLSGCGPLQKVI